VLDKHVPEAVLVQTTRAAERDEGHDGSGRARRDKDVELVVAVLVQRVEMVVAEEDRELAGAHRLGDAEDSGHRELRARVAQERRDRVQLRLAVPRPGGACAHEVLSMLIAQ
jgi:hypothetical protein